MWRPAGRVRRTISRWPVGQPVRVDRPVSSATPTWESAWPSWCRPGSQAWAGRAADGGLVGVGDGPADGVVHGAAGGVQGLQVGEQLVGGAGTVDADQQLGPPPCGELFDRGGEYLQVVGHGVGAGVARAEQHRQRFAGVGAPGGQRVEPETLFERYRRALLG